MKKQFFGRDLVVASTDVLKEAEESHMKSTLEGLLYDFPMRESLKRLVHLYGRRYGLRGSAVLEAHGKSEDGRWIFYDGNRVYFVQNWIDQMDGKFLILFLNCCNPRNHRVYSERSIVVHGRGNTNILDILGTRRTMIYIPGGGYLDHSYYRIRRAIERLKRR